jgi:hypothetical protein
MRKKGRRCAMTTSQHAAGLVEGKMPTAAQLEELFAQIKIGRITSNKFQKLLRGQILGFDDVASFAKVKEILGEKNFLGPVEWYKYFPKLVDLKNLSEFPKIPWSEKELRNLKSRYFLFLGIEYLGGKPLTPNSWPKLLSKLDYQLEFDLIGLTRLAFMEATCEFRWYLMPIGVFPGSINKYIDDQMEILRPTQWWIPTVVERLTANILFYLLNDIYLDNATWATTRDNFGAHEFACIRSFEGKLCLGSFFAHHEKDKGTGIAASMKLPA